MKVYKIQKKKFYTVLNQEKNFFCENPESVQTFDGCFVKFNSG
jgi:hypothetical protein